MVTRRRFIKNTVAGTAALSSTSNIFFPKPAISSSINYLLSADGTSTAVLQTLMAANISRSTFQSLPPETDPEVVEKINIVNAALVADNFTENPTPLTLRLGNPNTPLLGRQRDEVLGPNPGFGTVQVRRNRFTPIAFTGSTTAGIDSAVRFLLSERYTAQDLDGALIPVQERFEDWGTWAGDADPETGEISERASITEYETRYGSVFRRYEVVEPGLGGYGTIRFEVRGGQRINATIRVRVEFAKEADL